MNFTPIGQYALWAAALPHPLRKASGFPAVSLVVKREALPRHSGEAKPHTRKRLSSLGKPEAFRKGGGKAANAIGESVGSFRQTRAGGFLMRSPWRLALLRASVALSHARSRSVACKCCLLVDRNQLAIPGPEHILQCETG